ncbi:MAG: histidine kinase [Prolixibacteraceae bacterium]|jgi:two-component system LytT family sensor kinase|nr:histidine kinase [Prolixibacteraceae bacterium]
MKNVRLSYIDAFKYATIIFVLVSLLVLLLLYFGTSAFIPTGERPHFDRGFNRWMPVIGALETYLYLFVLFAINFKILESKVKGRGKIIIVISATVATAFIFNLIVALFIKKVVIEDNIPLYANIGPLIKNLFFAAIVFFLSLIIYLSSQKQKMVLEYEAMKTENERSRFEALKNQLDPHFLFNTFNTLDSLIEEEPARARNYLQQLSSVFRYVISNKESTTLENELKFAHNYNELMQLRYENSLVFEFHIDEQYLAYRIVPLSIQTLIENAIKHNVISSDTPFVIRVTVGPDPVVIVSNKIIPKKTSQTGSGIGLSNLAERFKLKLQKEIEISDKDGTFTVILPLYPPKNNFS